MEELIPHVDASYRTISERQGRGIEGFSMGGYGSAYLGIKYNDLFSSVSVLAGALHTPQTFRDRRRAIFDNVFSGDFFEYYRRAFAWNNNAANKKVIVVTGAASTVPVCRLAPDFRPLSC
ncbi:MAG: hypothetical protein KAJ57_05665 [Woeseiaceae bacterium]|nr:hypothetical protein [Woeseiaceae bacterium]